MFNGIFAGASNAPIAQANAVALAPSGNPRGDLPVSKPISVHPDVSGNNGPLEIDIAAFVFDHGLPDAPVFDGSAKEWLNQCIGNRTIKNQYVRSQAFKFALEGLRGAIDVTDVGADPKERVGGMTLRDRGLKVAYHFKEGDQPGRSCGVITHIWVLSPDDHVLVSGQRPHDDPSVAEMCTDKPQPQRLSIDGTDQATPTRS